MTSLFLLAQESSTSFLPEDPVNQGLAIAAILLAILVFSTLMLYLRFYKRCPSNKILVIYGKTSSGNVARCVHGGAAFVWPIIQDYQYLSLEPMQIEIPLRGALSMENIRVNVPSVFTVAVGTDPATMTNAAIRLLGLDFDQIRQQTADIIFGQLRQVIASMGIEDINRDRDKFLENIQSSLEPELKKIGLVLINVNITDLTDESGYIEAIGRKAASQAIEQARIDVAVQEKHGNIGVAEAEREKAISVAEASKLREIGVNEAQREQAIRLADLAKEREVGEQRAAFERESQVADANREKRIRIADADAKAYSGEAASKADIADAEATLKVKQAEAYQLGETRRRESQAAVLEAENHALAKAAIAEAERVEAEQRAKLEATAKAEKARIIVDAQAEGERKRIDAEAEAAAIFAKLEAEAKGQFEILAKKGDGLKKIIQACGTAREAFQLLLLEHMDHLAEVSAKAISNIKFDKVVVWEGNGSNGRGSQTSRFLSDLAHSLPPMLQVMRDIGGVDVPDYLASLAGEEKGNNASEGHDKVAATNGEVKSNDLKGNETKS